MLQTKKKSSNASDEHDDKSETGSDDQYACQVYEIVGEFFGHGNADCLVGVVSCERGDETCSAANCCLENKLESERETEGIKEIIKNFKARKVFKGHMYIFM